MVRSTRRDAPIPVGTQPVRHSRCGLVPYASSQLQCPRPGGAGSE
ncbi:hypothetical protein [Lysobacter gummosus]